MDERGQFTFYRSFWEAVKGLPKKDRLPILETIISYALNGIAYKDDSRVHRGSCVKYYSAEPRLEIVIREVGG